MAYERVSGPIDSQWRDEALATLVDLTHQLLYLTGQQFTDKTHRKGPIEKPEGKYTRPGEIYTKARES